MEPRCACQSRQRQGSKCEAGRAHGPCCHSHLGVPLVALPSFPEPRSPNCRRLSNSPLHSSIVWFLDEDQGAAKCPPVCPHLLEMQTCSSPGEQDSGELAPQQRATSEFCTALGPLLQPYRGVDLNWAKNGDFLPQCCQFLTQPPWPGL